MFRRLSGNPDRGNRGRLTALEHCHVHEEIAWPLLEKMLLIRRFEEAVLRLSNENQFIGHYHLYIGQEGTGSALISLLEPRDRLATTHRNHGHVLARGADPGRAMAEILGRAAGLYGGRGGTIHLGDPDLGFISTSGDRRKRRSLRPIKLAHKASRTLRPTRLAPRLLLP